MTIQLKRDMGDCPFSLDYEKGRKERIKRRKINLKKKREHWKQKIKCILPIGEKIFIFLSNSQSFILRGWEVGTNEKHITDH